jgi:hypothetical protein
MHDSTRELELQLEARLPRLPFHMSQMRHRQPPRHASADETEPRRRKPAQWKAHAIQEEKAE